MKTNERKVISEEFLLQQGFKKNKYDTFLKRIQNNAVFRSVEIAVEVISPAVGASVAIRSSGTTKWFILPIDYEDQLTKLQEALQGI